MIVLWSILRSCGLKAQSRKARYEIARTKSSNYSNRFWIHHEAVRANQGIIS
jgi:hypothetical protein